ncbi:MAG TPA: AraC family transcriptional regulator [Magnetovibrio sp.]
MAHLEHYEIIASSELHEMQDMLARMTETHKVDVIGKRHEIQASLRSAAIGDLSLMHVTYGDVPTSVQTFENDEDALLLFIMTGGAAGVRHKGEDFDISTTTGLMRDARLPLTASQDSFASFVVPLPKDILKRHASALQGMEEGDIDITFDTTLDLNTPNGKHLRNTVNYIADALDGPLRGVENTILFDNFRDLLLTSVLSLVSTLPQKTQPSGRILPYYVKRAREYIYAYAGSSITLDVLANYAGCGYRTLQVAFNDAFGMSPMAYVMHVRLTFAHEDLLRAADGVTVRDIALKWGFTHLGWFSKKYTEQFGVSPSQTLRMRG